MALPNWTISSPVEGTFYLYVLNTGKGYLLISYEETIALTFLGIPERFFSLIFDFLFLEYPVIA